MDNLTIGFVGLGLIGGSMAKAIKRVHPDYKIIAYNRTLTALTAAKSDNVVDIAVSEIDETFATCDYIFLCTPVELNSLFLEKLKPIRKDSCVITDVGSVKSHIHQAVINLCMEDVFIGGHPMAGSEKTGYENSNAYLLENAYYAITPTTKTSKEALDGYSALVKDMGAIPVVIDYETHDYSVAGISHLPHVVASSLVNFVKNADTDAETMKMLAAGGFKDITRIASSSPTMWQQICMTNGDKICSLIEKFKESLNSFEEAIKSSDEKLIYNLFDESKEYRDSINTTSKGLMSKTFVINCDIIDEKGAIATIATILAINDISIKNIGIIHNREFEQGVLRIELYDNDSMEKAISLLEKHRYVIYKK